MKKMRRVKFIAVLCAVIMIIFNCLCACGANSNGNENGGAVNFSQLTYVTFGDSITWGQDGESKVQVQMKVPYPVFVNNELGLKQTLNYAKCGATIRFSSTNSFVGAQVNEATQNADIVSVMIGVNDFAGSGKLGVITDTEYDTIYGSLNKTADLLLTKYPNAFLFFITPLEQTKNPEINSAGYKLVDVANAIKEVCAAKNIAVLDLHTAVEFSKETDPNSDGLHPTQEFCRQQVAPKVVQFIKDYYNV